MNIDTAYNLELVEDDIDEDEHKKLDAKLHRLFPLSEEILYDYGPTVLNKIVQQLGDHANKQYLSLSETTTLIANNSDIRAMLLAGSNDGYKLVRRLRMLRKDEQPATLPEHTSTGKSFCGFIRPTDPAREGWNCEYRGNHHEIMLKNINSLERSTEHVNCLSLIQSSGTGKSRMVDEMAKLVFTIPFNLRHPAEGRQGAYPPEDTVVWDYLCASEVSTVNQGEDRSALFFQNLFSEVNTEVQCVLHKRERISSEQFARQWHTHLSERGGYNRRRLYEGVVHKCKTAPAKSSPPRNSAKLADNRKLLLATLGEHCIFKAGQVKILLYFDEAHELGKHVDPNEKKKRYDILWSSLDKFKTASIFTLFLSTQSSVPLLAPSALAARSSRQLNPDVMWGPITETAFDCHPSFPLRPGLRLADIQKLEFLTRFGRPLFWTMLDKDDPKLLDDMLNLARKKLLFDDHIFAPSHSDIAMSAILDVLITIDYEPKRVDANEREMEMVASHMRIAFSVPNHRMYIRSGYPSEPFLAEAASRQMYHYYIQDSDKRRFSMVQLLQRDLEHGLIDLGQKGEVGTRLLLREAYMKAIIAEQKVEGNKSPNFSAGCKFLGFLEALFAEQFHTSIMGCGPANKGASPGTLQDTFKNAVVRFTHFAKAADSSLITTRGMMMGFLRGAAIMGHNNQEGIDIAIPILLNKNKKIKEASMSAFLIQVKRRHRSGSVNAYLIDATKLGFFGDRSTEDVRPYVTLVAELGVTPPNSTPNVVVDQSGERASSRLTSKSTSPKEHPRYSIRAYQCSHKTWGVIHPDDVARYNQLLCLDELLADHPRQDSESLQLTRQLLPVWYRVPAWLPGEEDSKDDDDEDDEDEEDRDDKPSPAMEL